MINLLTFFRNHFDSSEFSNANFLRFSESHLQRMIRKNTNSLYDERIALLRDAIEAFKKALNEEDTSFALQQAQTKRTDDLIADFKSGDRRHCVCRRAPFFGRAEAAAGGRADPARCLARCTILACSDSPRCPVRLGGDSHNDCSAGADRGRCMGPLADHRQAVRRLLPGDGTRQCH